MKKTRKVLRFLLCLVLIAGILPVSALAADDYVAKIGDTPYTDIDDAIEAASDGDTITLLANVKPKKTFYKSLTFIGGYTMTYDIYGWRYTGKTLVFDGANLVINSDADRVPANNGELTTWGALILSNSTIKALNNASIKFEFNSDSGTNAAIYTENQCSIIVDDESRFAIIGHKTAGVIGDGIMLGTTAGTNITVTNGSNFLIEGSNRGYVNSPEIYVEDSTFTVQNCTSNGSNGGNFTAINSKIYFLNNNGHGLSASKLSLTKSNLTANENNLCGVIVAGETTIQSSNVTIDKNNVNSDLKGRWARPGAFVIKNTSATISADSTVSICDNSGSGIFLWGANASLDMQSGTVMRNTANKSGFGGGIYNEGTVTLSPAVVLYNNHAPTAGDDLYNAPVTYNYNSTTKDYDAIPITSSITFSDVGSDWVLDDCDDLIDGWYEDGVEDNPGLRWNVHDETKEQHIVKKDAGEYTGEIAFKAAHGESVIPGFGIPILWLNMEDHYSYIVGYPDGTVQPNGKITRAEVATIFFRLLSDDTREAFWSSTNDYSDVTADKWYNNAVSTLSRLGVISGYPDGTFRPDASITRAEFAKIAVSFCKYGSTTYSGCFSDVKASDWFSACVETARNSNLIAGYPDGTFRPNNAITRAEACTIVNRTLGRKPAKNHMAISGRINWPDCLDTEWFYADMMEATNSHDYQMVGLVEDWNRKLPQRDWAALETEWSHAYSAPGGEVGR